MGAQALHFVQGEPFGACLGLGPALRQVGVLAQHAAEMLGCHRDQIAGDFPCGKQPQLALAVFLKAPADQILAPPAIVGRDPGQAFGSGRIVQHRQGPVGRDVEIGGNVLPAHRRSASCNDFFGSYQ